MHPHKSSGDPVQFIAAIAALEALTGSSPQLGSTKPKPNAALEAALRSLPPSAHSTGDRCAQVRQILSREDAERQLAEWKRHAIFLRNETSKTARMIEILAQVAQDYDARARRTEGETFTKQFRKSARFWDRDALQRQWCRDGRSIIHPEQQQRFDDAHGQDLRQSNEHLAPLVRFEGFHFKEKGGRPDAGKGLHKSVIVTVGRDDADISSFGLELQLPLAFFLGFDLKLADELREADAWTLLRDNGKLAEPPRGGVRMDVRHAKRLFDDLQREREMAWELDFAECAAARGWKRPVADIEAAAFARMVLREGRANEPAPPQPPSPLRREESRNVKMRKLSSMPDSELQEIAAASTSAPPAVQQ